MAPRRPPSRPQRQRERGGARRPPGGGPGPRAPVSPHRSEPVPPDPRAGPLGRPAPDRRRGPVGPRAPADGPGPGPRLGPWSGGRPRDRRRRRLRDPLGGRRPGVGTEADGPPGHLDRPQPPLEDLAGRRHSDRRRAHPGARRDPSRRHGVRGRSLPGEFPPFDAEWARRAARRAMSAGLAATAVASGGPRSRRRTASLSRRGTARRPRPGGPSTRGRAPPRPSVPPRGPGRRPRR